MADKENPNNRNPEIQAYKNSIKQAESGGNKNAKAKTSSATGLYQFTKATWSEMEKKLGKKLDIFSPKDQELAMNKLTEININALEKNNIPVTASNLYMTHFLGSSGGPKFLKNLEKNPNELATKYVSDSTAKANENLFYNNDQPISAAELYNKMSSKVNVQPQVQEQSQPIIQPSFNLPEFETRIDNTNTNQPSVDPNLKPSKKFTPKQVASNTNSGDNPVEDSRMSLGMSGDLDFLPKDINLAFLEEDQLEQEQLGQDVNMAKYGGNQKTDPPKKKPIIVSSKNDPRFKAYQDSLTAYNNDIGFDKEFKSYLSSNKLKDLSYNEIDKERLRLEKKYPENSVRPIKNSNLKKAHDIYKHQNYTFKDTQVYKKPTQAVILEQQKQRPKVQGLNTNITPEGIQSQQESPQGEELPQRTYAQIPKSYDVRSKRYNMQGENPYYNFNTENADYETALRAKLSTENYNADIERRYGNEEALKKPKAIERLKQLRQEINIKPNNFEYGGQMNKKKLSEGSLNEFNEGGSHEENKYGGIPQGIGENGQMNTVEEGETKFNNYVFSDTLKVNQSDIDSLFLPKELKDKTFAEASKYINEVLEDNPNDNIIKKTVKKQLDSLTLGNEKARLAKEQLDLNLNNSLEESSESNQMFLGGDTLQNDLMPGMQGGMQGITSLISGDEEGALSGGLNAIGSIGGTALAGPLGGMVGGFLGDTVGGLINNIGGGDREQRIANRKHIKESSQFSNDFESGGPMYSNKNKNGLDKYGRLLPNQDIESEFEKQSFSPEQMMAMDDMYGIESLKYNLTPDDQIYNDLGTIDDLKNYPSAEMEGVVLNPYIENNTYSDPSTAPINMKNNYSNENLMQYAPVLGNFLNYNEARNAKADKTNLNRLDKRFEKNYADEASIKNIINNDFDNTINSINNSINGSEGALRANLLGAGLNKTRASNDAYLKVDEINRGQDEKAQQFNLGVDNFNISQSNAETDMNAKSKAIRDDRETIARNRLFDSVGAIGKERTYDNRLKALTGGYDSMGNYNEDSSSIFERLLGYSKNNKEDDNEKKEGGFLSNVFKLTEEQKRKKRMEESFNNKYK